MRRCGKGGQGGLSEQVMLELRPEGGGGVLSQSGERHLQQGPRACRPGSCTPARSSLASWQEVRASGRHKGSLRVGGCGGPGSGSAAQTRGRARPALQELKDRRETAMSSRIVK